MPEHFTTMKSLFRLLSSLLALALVCAAVYHDIKGQDLKVVIDLVSFLVVQSSRAEMKEMF